MSDAPSRAGYTCCYTPLPLLEAAGLSPYRILPAGDLPDEAGGVLHDNLCPHVKRVLDRVLQDDLPPLTCAVIVRSCDAMRRLADAWRQLRPALPVLELDLPCSQSADDEAMLAQELRRLATALGEIRGVQLHAQRLQELRAQHREITARTEQLVAQARAGELSLSAAAVAELQQQIASLPAAQALAAVDRARATATRPGKPPPGAPIYLFGNVFFDPPAFELIERCGARIVGEDLCTGSRQLLPTIDGDDDPWLGLARATLRRPRCARTLDPSRPGALAQEIAERARACGARGVIGHYMKFCDPYLARLPSVRQALGEAAIPLLLIEGDCTLRSLGQQRTRIEAFVEMLG